METPARTNIVDLRSRAGDHASELLAGVRAATLRTLPSVLANVLDRADDALFDFVQKSSSSIEQQEYFDTMRELRRQRSVIEQRYREQIGASFAALGRGQPLVVRCAPKSEAEPTLSLLAADELDEQLAAEQLAGALERRHSGPLQLLDKKLAIVSKVDTLGPATNPAGPGHVVNALRVALEGIVPALPPRLVLYKIYERDVQNVLATLYAEINRLLADVSIVDPIAAARARRRDMPTSPKYPSQYAQPEQSSAPDYGHNQVGSGGYGGGSGAGYAPASQDIDELLPTLRALLGEYRSARQASEPAQHARGPMMDVHGTLNTLSRLQGDLPQTVRRAIDDPSASLSMLLKQEVLRQAEQMGLTGPKSRLDERGEESLELVGMLFDALLGQRNFEPSTRDQMARMVVPYAKASLLDQQMFGMKSHPARRLLNTVAEACDGNRGETSAERELLGRVEGTVDRLVSEFNEDLAIFSELDVELRSFFDQHKQRVELTERRATEAQRGKERLDEARAMANSELASLMGGRNPPPAIEQFLTHYWTHHIAVVALRDGVDSSRFKLARDAGDQLWTAFLGSENGAPRPVDLRDHLVRVLTSSGVTGVSADETVGAIEWVLQALRLGRVEAARSRNLPSVESVATSQSAPSEPVTAAVVAAPAIVPAAAADVGNEVAAVATPQAQDGAAVLDVVGGTATLAYDPEDVIKVKALVVGNWVEFIGADGVPQPAKLSWISPISSRLLFVNRRGMRLCASSAEELAEQMKLGNLLLRAADSAFERAMTQVLGKLRDAVPVKH